METLYRKFQNYSSMMREYHAIYIKFINKKSRPEDFKREIMIDMKKRRAENLEIDILVNFYHHEFLGIWDQYIKANDYTSEVIMQNLENLNELTIRKFFDQFGKADELSSEFCNAISMRCRAGYKKIDE